METTLENFTRKTCYDYFQTYGITSIWLLFVRILYSNYMLYYKKTREIHYEENLKTMKNLMKGIFKFSLLI